MSSRIELAVSRMVGVCEKVGELDWIVLKGIFNLLDRIGSTLFLPLLLAW